METGNGPEIICSGIQDLPVELWHEILSHLRFDASTLSKVCRLARSWHNLAITHLYRHVDLRDPQMKPQLLFIQAIKTTVYFRSLVQNLSMGICPPTHENGDFIYDLAETLGTLPNLECLELLPTMNTPLHLYTVEGNGNSIMRRYWRGEVATPPMGDPTYPQLRSFRVDIPMGYTVYSIFEAQHNLHNLELRYPSHFYRAEDIFRSPHLTKLALSGESILNTLPTTFKPTNLLLDCPASIPLWPSRLRKTYLSMPSTHLLHSLEISSTLVEELQICITKSHGANETKSSLTFPSLRHFGIFTSEWVDSRFLEERKFLVMWWENPAKRMLNLFVHFPQLESLSVMPENVGNGDWTDSILTDPNLLERLMDCCPRLDLLLWRTHAGRKAGGRWLREENNRVVIDEACETIFHHVTFAYLS